MSVGSIGKMLRELLGGGGVSRGSMRLGLIGWKIRMGM